MKNSHVPLPDETYDRLRIAAELRRATHKAIAAYAAETAGTSLDLDTDLEASSIDHLDLD